MTTWNQTTDGTTAYLLKRYDSESIWDDGLSVWDSTGNVALSFWDVSESVTSYLPTTGGTTVWA